MSSRDWPSPNSVTLRMSWCKPARDGGPVPPPATIVLQATLVWRLGGDREERDVVAAAARRGGVDEHRAVQPVAVTPRRTRSHLLSRAVAVLRRPPASLLGLRLGVLRPRQSRGP